MDAAISLTIMLFILSMINERISNFIKLQYSYRNFLGVYLGNLDQKTYGKKETERTKKIIGINIFCGTIVAICLRADLINILNHVNKPWEAIGWHTTMDWVQWLTLPLGCFLTGCFLSLGSKFWHDLLDLLLYVKNLKEKAVNETTYANPISAEQVQNYFLTPENRLAYLAVDQYKENLLHVKGVISVGTGFIKSVNRETACIEVHAVQTEELAQILPEYTMDFLGKPIIIPVKIVLLDRIPETCSADAGSQILNSSGILGKGTLGAVVKDNSSKKPFLLSCFHVLNGDTNWNSISQSKAIVDEQNTTIADLNFGFRTDEIDAAIAEIRTGVVHSNDKINNPKKMRQISYDDAKNQTEIMVYVANQDLPKTGIIYSDSWETTFKYPDGKFWKLKDLILLTHYDEFTKTYTTLTKKGDSGAMVIDKKNNLVGMIVGGDDIFSYAIKIDKIFKSLDINL